MNSRAKSVILGVIIGVIGLVVIYFIAVKTGGNSPVADSGASGVPSAGAVLQSDWSRGNRESKTILVEYSDFQCPACAAYHPLAKRLSEEFGDKMVFVYRHFPLSQHQNAELAAIAAEAAGKQGKFWEMHDVIFENQSSWSGLTNLAAKGVFLEYAEEIRLDVNLFRNHLDSQDAKQKVANDLESGIKEKVMGTPTFFLNGEKLSNPRSYEEFKEIMESAVNRQG